MKEDKRNKLRRGERAAGISTVTITSLALMEGLIGFLSGNIVLITDALHNVADSITSFASWFGLKISQRKPDERFPYGYYKVENLVTLFVSIFVLYAAYELLRKGYLKLYSISKINMLLESLIIAFISAVISYFLAKYMKKIGEDINSQSLIANAQERTTHVLSSVIIFIAILLTFFRIPYVEGVVTIVFSLVIFKIGISSSRDSIFALMDVTPSKDVEDQVKEIINSIAGVEEFENLKLRKAGPFVFGEVNVKIRRHVDVKRAHEIADNIENKIKQQVEQIDSFTIHIEPYETDEQKLAVPINQNRDLYSEVSDKFGRANYFIFVIIDKKRKKVKSSYVKKNPYRKEYIKAGFAAVNFIVKEKIDTLITKEIGDISFHTLRDHLVDIYKTKGKTVKDVINNFMKNRLEHLTEPTKKEKVIEQPREVKGGFGRRRRSWWRGWMEVNE